MTVAWGAARGDARVDDLLARNIGAGDGPDSGAEFSHGTVVLSPAVQAHVRVGQPLWYREGRPVRPNKCT